MNATGKMDVFSLGNSCRTHLTNPVFLKMTVLVLEWTTS